MRAAEVLGGDVAVGLARGGARHHEGKDVRVGAVLEPRRPVQQSHARASTARRTPGRAPVTACNKCDKTNTLQTFSSIFYRRFGARTGGVKCIITGTCSFAKYPLYYNFLKGVWT